MSFKSLIQDMRGELGSISRKGFDVRFGYGRSRSQRVVQDTCVPVDAFKQSCWASMPPELLRDVLMRIEKSEDSWPSRKNVVSCAGVCRNWREIVKEIVKVPEVSSKLTFPISLKQVWVSHITFSLYFISDSLCLLIFLIFFLAGSKGITCSMLYHEKPQQSNLLSIPRVKPRWKKQMLFLFSSHA